MLKVIIGILLITSPVVYYGRGYVGDIEVGNNTLYFGLTYLLYFWYMIIIYLMMVADHWGIIWKTFVMFGCCMTFLQTIGQVVMRLYGKQPDNNVMSIIAYGLTSIVLIALYKVVKHGITSGTRNGSLE